jgi:hypothetical protein
MFGKFGMTANGPAVVVVFGDERPEAVVKITSFRPDFIRPQEARHGAIFAIIVQS